jgi:phospholipid/cholesterol/gamma-HCH transport system permease protein
MARASEALREDRRAGAIATTDEGVLALSGDWTVDDARALDEAAKGIDPESLPETVTLDGADLGRLDTAGAFLVAGLTERLTAAGRTVENAGFSEQHTALIEALRESEVAPPAKKPPPNVVYELLYDVGKGAYRVTDDLAGILATLGEASTSLGSTVIGRRRMRWAAFVTQIDRAGFQAVPIIALMSFLIGMIVAQQGGFYLQTYGADVFVVDLVGILVFRELGVLLTAIMVAGRSGSAITAEIGSMKMREELDALNVLGVSTIDVLVLPRLLALIIALPLLAMISNFSALAGAWVMTLFDLGIPTDTFLTRLRGALSVTNVFIGLSKAPIMALIIVLVACVEGFKVEGSAESLGAHTTASVVKAIFLVVVLDGIFAIIFATLGV